MFENGNGKRKQRKGEGIKYKEKYIYKSIPLKKIGTLICAYDLCGICRSKFKFKHKV